MTTICFFIAAIAAVVFVFQMLRALLQRKDAKPPLLKLLGVAAVYAIAWLLFYLKQSDRPVEMGTDICFDDWCTTVLKADTPRVLGSGNDTIQARGRFVVLHVQMSNRARGIAQKPSEPRIHIIDNKGNSWAPSLPAQQALEMQQGKQTPLDTRLELSQSLLTQIVFDIPANASNLKVLIEEGPFITKLLFAEDRDVFELNRP